MNSKALYTVFFIVLIDLIGFGIVLPLLPFFASEFNASPFFIGVLFSIYSGMQLIFSPLWGAWSDALGRRPIMMISTLGNTLAYCVFAFSNSLGTLFFSRLMAGIMAGNVAAVQAYVTDVTTPQERTKAMGLIGAAFGMGFLIGPALASLLIHPRLIMFEQPFALPGLFAASLSFLSFLLVKFTLPETVDTHLKQKKRGIQGIFQKSFWLSLKDKDGAHLTFLFVCVGILTFGQSTLYGAFPLFCESRLGFTAGGVGLLFMYMAFIAVLVQGFLIRRLSGKVADEMLFKTGTLLMLTGMALIPWAGSQTLLMIFLAIMSVGASLNMPAIQSLVSKNAPKTRVGEVMGRMQAFAGLGRVIGPSWGGAFYGMHYLLPFVTTAAILTALFVKTFKLKK